ncbi:MAG: hypothetical protein HY000_08150 [Planctomycetes bacterium]|nr:hypothetical protein [Planctomycetota bacterium]
MFTDHRSLTTDHSLFRKARASRGMVFAATGTSMMKPTIDQAARTARRAFFHDALRQLIQAQVPFLVGGAFAFEKYTGISRDTKDFDIFVLPGDAQQVLDVLATAYHTEMTYPHWLGKVISDDGFIDVIFSSGNGLSRVDAVWFDHAHEGIELDLPLRFCPPEETIWSKGFVMERNRYDGADIAHLLYARAEELDWKRLLWRFGPHWRLLLSHLVLFGFIFPDKRGSIPAWVMDELTGRLKAGDDAEDELAAIRICRGPLLSLLQYASDLERYGYQDARQIPHGNMLPEDIEFWTTSFRP